MKKTGFMYMSVVALFAFALGAGFNAVAFSDAINTNGIKIAVVDVAKVVDSSSQVKALKKEQDQKRDELVQWLDTVKADIQKQTTEENKTKLAKKYDSELAKKQQANQSEYVKKISVIDADISKIVANTAKAQGYSLVFAKTAILYGGDDITASVTKAIK